MRSHELLAMLLVLVAADAQADTTDKIDAFVGGYQQTAAFDGVVLVANGDEIEHAASYGYADYQSMTAMSLDTRFRLPSLSTHVTQAAIGRLIDVGKLSLHARLADFLPDFPQARRITVRQLLTHSSGIVDTEHAAWMDMSVHLTIDEIVAALAGEKLLFAPGIDTHYSAGGYALLAKIIEVVSGASYRAFLQSTFADNGYPSLGDSQTCEAKPGLPQLYAPGPEYGVRVSAAEYVAANKIGEGSLCVNAGDLFRFLRDIYTGRLLSVQTTRAVFPVVDDEDIELAGRSPGALTQVLMTRADDVTVLILSSNSAWPENLGGDIAALHRGEFVTPISTLTSARQKLPVSEIDIYSGRFESRTPGPDITVDNRHGHLVFVDHKQATAFVYMGNDQFYLPMYDWLCKYSAYNTEFECRQRSSDSGTRHLFERQ